MPQINLTWEDRSLIEDGYYVYKDTSPIVEGALPAVYDTVAADTETYVDSIDMEDVLSEVFYYRVAAYKDSLQKLSNEISIGNPANPFYNESPTYIFKGGEEGYLNLLSIDTLFTDTAGTTPVTAIGDTIALGLDQSGNSNDMVQATAAARPVYGQMPVSGVVNLLASYGFPSEDFSVSAWNKSNTSVSGTLLTRISTEGGSYVGSLASAISGAIGEELTFYVDASLGSVGEELGIRFQGTYPNRADAVFNLSNGTIRGAHENTYTGVSASIEALGGGVYRCKLTATIQGTALQRIVFGSANPSGPVGQWEGASGAAGLIDVNVHRVQLQSGASAKDYQKVTSRYDIAQPGTPSVPIAYMDTSDDNFSWTLPAGTYHLFIAGDLGCYFDTVEHAGGEFTVGPTSWTGGPSGAITTLIGQRHVIMPVIRDEAFTQSEKELMVAYVMARGAPGVWEAGAELVMNGTFDSNIDGWAIGVDGTITWDAGTLNLVSSATTPAYTEVGPINSGEIYHYRLYVQTTTGQVARTVRNVTTLGGTVLLSNPGFQGSYPTGVSDSFISAATGSAANAYVQLIGLAASESNWDNVSLKKLTLNTDPNP